MKEHYENFEKNFKLLLKKEKEKPVTVHQFLTSLSGRGKVLFLIFFVLPFSQIPGIAILFGLVISYLGLRIGFNKTSIWLPSSWLRKKIPSYLLKKSIKQILFGMKVLKKWSRPRLVSLAQKKFMHRLNGLLIAVVGLALAACPPIPLTGVIAFVAILLIGIGLLNDDGIYLISGYVLTVGYFALTVYILKIFSLTAILEFLKGLI